MRKLLLDYINTDTKLTCMHAHTHAHARTCTHTNTHTCVVACCCVWSNSSNLRGLLAPVWNSLISPTLPHSTLTTSSTDRASTLVVRERNWSLERTFWNWKGGTSGCLPERWREGKREGGNDGIRRLGREGGREGKREGRKEG